MGDLGQLCAFGPLGLDEVLDQLFGEDAALVTAFHGKKEKYRKK